MNQIYLKTRYLFILLVFFACSVGMAQSPFQNVKKEGLKTVVEDPDAAKEQVSKKTGDTNSPQSNDTDSFFGQKEEDVKGKKLSDEEAESVKKLLQESQKKFAKKQTAEKTSPQDSVGTKLKSFAKSSNLTAKNIFEVKKENFNLSKSDKMQLKSISDNHGRTLVTYQQLHNNIPVEGAIYKVRENKTKIDVFGSTSKKLSLNESYKISAATAFENALKTGSAVPALREP